MPYIINSTNKNAIMTTIGNEKLDAFIIEKLENILIKMNKEDPLYIYWEQNDYLSQDQISIIINDENGWNSVENDIIDSNYHYIFSLKIKRLSKIITEFCDNNKIRFYDSKEIATEIISDFEDMIEVDCKIDDLINKTPLIPVRIIRYSNYDCINSHHFEGIYSYEKTYFGDTVDVLNLNPKKVKQALLANSIDVCGKWPDKHKRNGKEFISYDDFIVEVENRTCPACLIVITGMLDIKEVHKEHNRINIPKGNKVGFFSPSHGGGSMIDAELIKDVFISTKPGKTEYDRWELIIDTNPGDYSIEETYGVVKDFFGKEVKLTKTR